MRDVKSPRNVALFAILKDEGGINASVPPGKYLFNVVSTPVGAIIKLDPT